MRKAVVVANPPEYRFCGACGARYEKEAVAAELSADKTITLRPQLALEVSLQPEPAPIQLGGERRLATVLVADVMGSTNLLERIGTESWVEIMNHVLRLLETRFYRLGGPLDHFYGDGLVGFFGLLLGLMIMRDADDPILNRSGALAHLRIRSLCREVL